MSKYRRYPKYRDSGVEWIGEVPERWKTLKIKRLADLRSGEMIGPDRISESGDYPVFGGNGLRGYTNSYTHDGEYALIGRQGALCGNINYARGKFWASEHAVVATCMRGVNTHWLGEMLRAANLNQYSTSAAQPGLSVEVISNLYTVAPLAAEQTAIASYLDRATARIDALVAKTTRFITLLKEKRQALITHAVTKGLNPDAKMKDSGVEWIGEVPEGWEVAQLRRLVSIENGLDYKDVAEPDGAIPVIGSGGEFARASSPLFKGESVLLGRKGTIDKPLYMNGAFWVVDTMFYTVVRDEAVAKFVYYAATTIPFNFYSTNTALPSMTQEDLSAHRLAIPPASEQTAIAAYLDRATARIDKLVSLAERSITLLKEKRSALITAAVTGQIDVRGEASDGASSEMLEELAA